MHGFENLEPLLRHSESLQPRNSCEADKQSGQHNEEENDIPQQNEDDGFDWRPKFLSESGLWGRFHGSEGLYAALGGWPLFSPKNDFVRRTLWHLVFQRVRSLALKRRRGGRAPRKFGDFGDKRFVGLTPVDDDFVSSASPAKR